MNRTPSLAPHPMQTLGEMIDLTQQAHANSVQLMLDSWEGGLEFFANLIKHAEEITARSGNPPSALLH